jgi:hypothetical protein
VFVVMAIASACLLAAVIALTRSRPAPDDELSSWHDGLDALDRIDRRRVRR